MDKQIKAKIMNRVENLTGVVREETMLMLVLLEKTPSEGIEKEFFQKLYDDKHKEYNLLYEEIQNELNSYFG